MRALLCLLVAACSAKSPPPVHSGDARTAPATPTNAPPMRPPAAIPCEALDPVGCEQAGDCHAEFAIKPGCSGSTCMTFAKCRTGNTASCTKPSTNCDEPDPKCEQHGDFRVKWVSGCHEGCVRTADCSP